MDLWLMSCRVLKRELEYALLDVLVERALARDLHRIVGFYLPTKKNAMVAQHYENLGFTLQDSREDGSSTWTLNVRRYVPKSQHIALSTAAVAL